MAFVEGSATSNVSPLLASIRLPFINNFCGFERKSLTGDIGSGMVTVSITVS
jgi:hypothetical protein